MPNGWTALSPCGAAHGQGAAPAWCGSRCLLHAGPVKERCCWCAPAACCKRPLRASGSILSVLSSWARLVHEAQACRTAACILSVKLQATLKRSGALLQGSWGAARGSAARFLKAGYEVLPQVQVQQPATRLQVVAGHEPPQPPQRRLHRSKRVLHVSKPGGFDPSQIRSSSLGGVRHPCGHSQPCPGPTCTHGTRILHSQHLA